MNITESDITEMTHEELANHAIRVGRSQHDDALESLGRDLLVAVENEGDSAAVVEQIKAHLWT